MKKGFTLAELIAVIVILALISLVSIPAVSGILKQNKERLCETQLENILAAAKSYGADNVFSLPDTSMTINLQTLVDAGYIAGEIENPITKENFDLDTTEITITKNNKKYEYTLDQDTKDSCGTE